MFGLLNIHKPAGITSRDVVNHVQRLVKPIKVGHAGTLDPLATGVLIVVLGSATRLTEYAQQSSKTYVGDFRFGLSSDTEDITGKVEAELNPSEPTLQLLEATLPQFLGTIQQRPPIFSALKVSGRRAYDLARQGETPDLAPREIEIHSLKILNYQYPDLQLEIVCGSGTYVRSLGRDLAIAVNTNAVMTNLVRTRIGPWHLEQAVNLPQLSSREEVAKYLLPPTQALQHLPVRSVSSEEVVHLSHGKLLPLGMSPLLADQEVMAIDPQGQLVAILTTVFATPEIMQLKVVRFFPDCLPAKVI